MNFLKLVLALSVFLFVLTKPVTAQDSTQNSFITLVNPVRVSSYNPDPISSLVAQYYVLSQRSLPATWLLTFDIIDYPGTDKVLKSFDNTQEFGIFMEVTEKFAEKAGVKYNKTDSWHRSNAIFLSGYLQEDRKKLIDTVFESFKQKFGYYPTSVGAWWIDSYSLEYMKEKYGITANLICSDQHSTDGYQLWGQYWSTPYYPSKLHAGMPANTPESKLDLVTIQWAHRDPLNGYGKDKASLYSTQDYFTIKLPDTYYDKLIDLYAKQHQNRFGQITLGLEGDLTASSYSDVYTRNMDSVVKARDELGVNVVNMKDFSVFYRENFPELSPDHLIESEDLLGEGKKSFWYQSPNYRVGLIYEDNQIKIVDYRVYKDKFDEPYYLTPNKQIDLKINTPSVIDSAMNHEEVWAMPSGKLLSTEKNDNSALIKAENLSIEFGKNSMKVNGNEISIPEFLKRSPKIDVVDTEGVVITPKENWISETAPQTFDGISIRTEYFLRTKKAKLAIAVIVALFITGTLGILIISKTIRKRTVLVGCWITVFVAAGLLWWIFNKQTYQIIDEEINALSKLRSFPDGKVIVYDDGCQICHWNGKYPPPAFGNQRNYIGNISQKSVVYNDFIFKTDSRDAGKKQLDSIGAKYVYLTKFDDYQEKMPFSPGDYNVELIFENANVQIWKIK